MSQESKPHRPCRVLFLCTGNSCRSQMAEGWCRHWHAGEIEAYSAGIEKHGMNARAMQVMLEAGVDISGQWSKTVAELGPVAFDLVITVCGHANERCPVFLGGPPVVHCGFDDPPKLAPHATTEVEALAPYRRVRDEISLFVRTLPNVIRQRLA